MKCLYIERRWFKIKENRLINLFKKLNCLLSTLDQISAQKLLEYVPYSEYNDIYVKFEFGKQTDIVVSLFNTNTRCIVKKIYTFSEILKKCSNIVTVMEFMNTDTINLYNKSKERVFDKNTVLII